MIRLDSHDRDFKKTLNANLRRKAYSDEVETKAAEVLAEIRLHGDKAVLKYAAMFDKASFKTAAACRVTDKELSAAFAQVSDGDKAAIQSMIDAVTDFAKRRIPKDWSKKVRKGVVLGERFVPMQRVAVYVPGGTAPLVSTVAHTASIAKAAGVPEIVALTPPRPDGSVNPHILCAMKLAGIQEIYKLGGIYAIGAVAYGTQTIRKVEKIVGPGNAWVTAAKKLVYGEVAIDMVAGPSEVMVIADRSANPEWVAADLLSQLEHGGGNLAILASPHAKLIRAVETALPKLAKTLSRHRELESGLESGCILIKTETLEEAADIASFVAPEHLELQCDDPESLLPRIRAAGAVFMGHFTPEPVGDFVAGPSHVLPTAGSACWFSGLAADAFFRRMSTLSYSEKALQREMSDLKRIADMEQLDAHKLSAVIRVES